ncbi:MAG: AHH domain-containing protein [Gammaproteobacteria bacterium]|nr:AHH domain-containing protein [Gammaproteobacteria bacterium]
MFIKSAPATRHRGSSTKTCVQTWHGKKPNNTAAHHIPGWGDPRAQDTLRILVRYEIPFDHEALGVYLPIRVADTPHPKMPNAYSHQRTHTGHYYRNVFLLVDAADVPGATQDDILKVFREIGKQLQTGTFPIKKSIKKEV